MNLEDFAKYQAARAEGKRTLAGILEGRLVVANRLLAMQLCNRYRQGLPGHLPMEDAEQAAMIGMLRALRQYDPAKGKFSNLAGWWVRHEMQVAAANEDRLMDGLQGRKRRAPNRKIDAHLAQHGTYGTPAEMGVKAEDVEAHRTTTGYVRVSAGMSRGSNDSTHAHDASPDESGFRDGATHHLSNEGAPTAEDLLIAREDALEAVDAVPSSRPIPVWALAERLAFGRLASELPLPDRKILDDLVATRDTVAKVARRHHRPKAYVLKLCKAIDLSVRDAWHEGPSDAQ